MKVNRLETHDRLEHFMKDQEVNIFQGAQDCLLKNELSLSIQEKSPYVYLFAHPRTADDGVTKVMYWQPRLSIPQAQDNSYLFRAISNTDVIQVVWIIPPKIMWKQFQKGNVTESDVCLWSINMYKNQRPMLEKPHPEDMTEEQAKAIMQAIVNERLQDIRSRRVIGKTELILNPGAY